MFLDWVESRTLVYDAINAESTFLRSPSLKKQSSWTRGVSSDLTIGFC